MPDYSQANRPIKVTTALGADELLLVGFTGEEAVSRLFSFRLDLMSTNNAVDPKDLLRKPATITIDLPDGGERVIHGIVKRFTQLGSRDDLTFYAAEIVPWLWFLSLSHDCMVFQNLSVPEILEKVFKALGYTDFKNKCTRTYPKREYCVQYRESHLNFAARLMEEEGIFYFFEHTDSKHTMVLADANSTFEVCPGAGTARLAERTTVTLDVVTAMTREDTVSAGTVTLRDYDDLQPSLTLKSSISGESPEEIYEYQPVLYTKLDEGDRYARIRLEAEEVKQRTVHGESSCRGFIAGFRTEVENHYRDDMNGAYMLTHVRHAAHAGDYRSWDSGDFDYQNTFVCIPFDVPYRPQRSAEKPLMRGSQTAVVVGKSGEEIWTDKHGRVKVQFHWDREGKKDEKSSCWVRVSSAWAGKAWGAIHLPRIGQEVIVDFLEGDIDRPIIVGRVYNAEQTPPYTLPTDQTQSGIKSRSSKGGGTEDYNELRFEDKKGSELIYEHAQKDMQVMVENDRTEEVKKNEKITIGANRTEEVKADEKITIHGNRTEEVKKNETIKVAGNRKEEVSGNETIKIDGKREEEVKGTEKVTVDGGRTVEIKANDKLTVSANLEVKANANIEMKAASKIAVEANAGIELKVGACTIKVTPAGIELKAPQIKLEGMAMVQLKAPMVMGQADAVLQMKGAIAQVNGDGVVMVKGGVTMIN